MEHVFSKEELLRCEVRRASPGVDEGAALRWVVGRARTTTQSFEFWAGVLLQYLRETGELPKE